MKINQKVSLVDADWYGKETGIKGNIAGMGHMIKEGVSFPIYIVQLDNGFFDPSEKVYVSVLVVHRQNLIPIY